MKAKEFRKLARENLNGRWGNFALLTFLYTLFIWLIGMAAGSIPIIGGVAIYIITPVLAFGFIKQMILLKKGIHVDYLDFFTFGFKKFADVWKVWGWLFLKYLGPIIMIFISIIVLVLGLIFGAILKQVSDVTTSFVSGVIICSLVLASIIYIAAMIWLIPLSYKYAFAYYELAMNPEMKAKDVVELSGKKMVGNRWRYFKLSFSFIGWSLLACLGLGIPFFWLTPYMNIASIFFYESLFTNQDGVYYVENLSENNKESKKNGPIDLV